MTTKHSHQNGLLGAKAFGRGPGRFVKKPVEIRAIQFTGDNFNEIIDFFGDASVRGIYGLTEKNPDHLILTTTHGDPAPCRSGDWVIPDSKPETFYPCKPDVFEATYEVVKD